MGVMLKMSDPWTLRQQRQLSFISEFTTDIKHLSGKNNYVADCLTRSFVINVTLGVHCPAMAAAQVTSEYIQAYRTAITTLKLADIPVYPSGSVLLCDISTCVTGPLVPLEYRKSVFNIIYNLAQPGRRATQKLISDKFIWHGLNKQVNQWTRECLHCQTGKLQTHVRAPLTNFTVPEKRFSYINMDIVGHFAPSHGFSNLLTIVDRTTRWPKAIPLRDISRATCARALIHVWIARFGAPLDMTSDRGSQFTSAL